MQPANHPMARKTHHKRMPTRPRWRWLVTIGVLFGLVVALLPLLMVRPPLVQPAKDRPVAVIDAGHGAFTETGVLDVGTSHYGLTEAALVLDLAQRLQRLLEQRGWVAVTTRDGDFTPYRLMQRALFAQKVGADVFISLHLNSHTSRRAHGVEVFYWRPEDYLLAELLQMKLSQRLGLRNRGVASFPYTVLVWSPVPAVLVELGFLSNRREAQRLNNPQFREKAATVLAEGLAEWWQTQQRERSATLSSSVPFRH